MLQIIDIDAVKYRLYRFKKTIISSTTGRLCVRVTDPSLSSLWFGVIANR